MGDSNPVSKQRLFVYSCERKLTSCPVAENFATLSSKCWARDDPEKTSAIISFVPFFKIR